MNQEGIILKSKQSSGKRMSDLSLLVCYHFIKNQLGSNQVALCHISIGNPRIILCLIVTKKLWKNASYFLPKRKFFSTKNTTLCFGLLSIISLMSMGSTTFVSCPWTSVDHFITFSLGKTWLFILFDGLFVYFRVFIQRREGASKIEKKINDMCMKQAFQQFFMQFLTINLISLIPIL